MKFRIASRFKGFAEKAPIVPCVLLVASVLLAAGGDAVQMLARFERAALADGEWWRLLTGHLVHLGPGHVLMNLAALAVAAVLLHGVLTTAQWIGGVLLSALAIDAGLYWLAPEVAWYVGLSGVLHGVLTAGGLRMAACRAWLGGVLLVGIAAKLIWEQRYGAVPLSAPLAGGSVVVHAHLYGAIGGGVSQLFAEGVRRVSALPR